MNPDTTEAPQSTSTADPAVSIIRAKIDALYSKEPEAKEELREADTEKHRSKHQEFMHQLSSSGKSLAEIQTAWHNYYTSLPDDQKHQVWQEFYEEHSRARSSSPKVEESEPKPVAEAPAKPKAASPTRSVAEIKQQLAGKIETRSKLSVRHHIQSLLFGLSMGAVVVLVLLFSFFNERFIAPFITPSKSISSTPIIIDPNSTTAGPNPEVVIPKINVEIPVVYGNTIDDNTIENELQDGVVHYATSPSPGEVGNVAIVGHSSNNIFNKGKYKFAFVLLSKLENGDTFSLTKNGKRYVYRVYTKRIVSPTDVSVLGPADKPATATLITCDPPGTSLHRLVVTGEQISPDPASNGASTAIKTNQAPTVVPGNSISLWQRLLHWINS